MTNLTRATPRPATRAATPKPRMLIVRRPVKAVGPQHEPDPLPVRLAIGVIVALGVTALIWLAGYFGYRLGFAPMVRVPELLGHGQSGLITGVLMLLGMPGFVLTAGLARPELMMLWFAVISIAGGGLAAARPLQPGGPRPSIQTVVFAAVGAIGCGLVAITVVWWSSSGIRNDLIGELPFLAADRAVWLENLRSVAGLDVLATFAAAVWMVLAMRLPIPRWMRGLAASAAFFGLGVMLVAMSSTTASAALVTTPRSVYLAEDGSVDARLLLGSTHDQTAILRMTDGSIITIELTDSPSRRTVVDRLSIVDYLDEMSREES